MKKIYNIGILAHIDAGKTSLTEQILYTASRIRAVGSVDRQNSVTDFTSMEKQRGISVFSAFVSFEYKGNKINIIDTPGHTDFASEVSRALGLLDMAILIVSAPDGVQAQTEILMTALNDLKIPFMIFLNKTDRLFETVDEVIDRLNKELSINTIHLNKWLADECNLEVLCDFDEELTGKYLENLPIAENELKDIATREINLRNIIPIVSGSAKTSENIPLLLESLLEYFTPPEYSEDDDVSGIIFKVDHTNTALGKCCYIKLLGGKLQVRDSICLNGKTLVSKITQIKSVFAGKQTDMGNLLAGDIGAVYGISDAKAGDSFGEHSAISTYPLSTPLLKVSITPKDAQDLPKLVSAVSELACENPSLDMIYESQTQEISVSITGVLAVELLQNQLTERYDLSAIISPPTIIYKETPISSAYGFEAYTMPKPCWAIVKLKIEPLPPKSGVVFESCVQDRDIHYYYQEHVKTSVFEYLKQGNFGWEVTDVKITLVGGADHNLHTHPLDFFLATPIALLDGLRNAKTTLLEPYNRVKFVADELHLGKIMADIIAMRGQFDSPIVNNNKVTINADIPVATFNDYPITFASLTSGKGLISARFLEYRPCDEALGKTTPYRGVWPLDRAKWILYKRNAIN